MVLFAYTNKTNENDAKNWWITILNFNENFSVVLGNDSYDHLTMAMNPEEIVGSYRQSRPVLLYIAASIFMLGKTFSNYMEYFGLTAPDDFIINYCGFIGINIFIMLFNFFLVEKLLLKKEDSPKAWLAVLLINLIMITDDLVKGFIFSAHYQMFQFSVPLISLVFLQWFQEQEVITWRIVVICGFVAGFLLLTYAAFLILAASLSIYIIYFFWKDPFNISARAKLMSILKYTSAYTICFITPTLVWSFTLAYYCDVKETGLIEIKKFNQFIWFWESYNSAGLHGMVIEMCRRLPLFFESLIKESWFYFLGFMLFVVLNCYSKNKIKLIITNVKKSKITLSFLICLIPSTIFWYFEGLYIWRYMRTFITIVIVALGWVAITLIRSEHQNSRINYILLTLFALLSLQLYNQLARKIDDWS